MSTVSVDGFIVVSKALESGLRKKGRGERETIVLCASSGFQRSDRIPRSTLRLGMAPTWRPQPVQSHPQGLSRMW